MPKRENPTATRADHETRTIGRGTAAIATVALTLGTLLAPPPSVAAASPADEMKEAREQSVALYAEAERVNEELNGTNLRLEETERRIREIEKDIEDDRTSLRAQMRSAYKGGQQTLLDVVMDSESIERMIDSAEYSERIQSENMDSIRSVMDSTKALREAREDAKRQRDASRKLADELDTRIREVDRRMEGLTKELRESLGVDQQDGSWDIPENITAGTGEAWRDVVLTAAYANLGGAYVWGGEDFKAADCSGLSMWCYAQAGISIPHYSEDQAAMFCDKPISEAIPGDVLWRPGHIGIYIGDGRTIEAMNPAMGITYGDASGFQACGSPV